MKKLMLLLICCLSLTFTVSAQTYEDIAELVLPSTERVRHAVFSGDYCYGIVSDGTLALKQVYPCE